MSLPLTTFRISANASEVSSGRTVIRLSGQVTGMRNLKSMFEGWAHVAIIATARAGVCKTVKYAGDTNVDFQPDFGSRLTSNLRLMDDGSADKAPL
jgi:hypothetical protein